MADFERLFRENRTFIFGYLLKLCRNASLAEELTQETFFRAYINLPQLKNEENAPAWLCRIAKNAYFAWYNEQKHLRSMDDAAEIADPSSVENLCVTREMTDAALRALHQLEEPYREVFLLSVSGRLSLREISRLFGKSESWARVTFYRAKQKLIKKLEK